MFRVMGDGALLARGETDWVYFDVAAGRPRSIPETIAAMFNIPPDGWEPSAALVPARSPIATALAEQLGWRQVGDDEGYVLLTPERAPS